MCIASASVFQCTFSITADDTLFMYQQNKLKYMPTKSAGHFNKLHETGLSVMSKSIVWAGKKLASAST